MESHDPELGDHEQVRADKDDVAFDFNEEQLDF